MFSEESEIPPSVIKRLLSQSRVAGFTLENILDILKKDIVDGGNSKTPGYLLKFEELNDVLV